MKPIQDFLLVEASIQKKVLMEDLPLKVNVGEISFRKESKSACQNQDESMQWTGAHQHMKTSRKGQSCSFIQSSAIPSSPADAMDFLCRSWSPSASDFLDMFSSNNHLPSWSIKDKTKDRGKKQEVEPLKGTRASKDKADNRRMDLKGWLKGQSLTSFLKSRKEKRREELRFQTAKLHVALSVTRLAAAISSFATNGGTIAHDQRMGEAVASAAALLTVVWAETAESLGAPTVAVASAINGGLTAQTPTEMIALTATAATCLRGAATLESRTRTVSNLEMNQEVLKDGARICTILPSGQREYLWVTMRLKNERLAVNFKKKYLGGVLSTSKEYMALDTTEETNEGQSNFFLGLKTNRVTSSWSSKMKGNIPSGAQIFLIF